MRSLGTSLDGLQARANIPQIYHGGFWRCQHALPWNIQPLRRGMQCALACGLPFISATVSPTLVAFSTPSFLLACTVRGLFWHRSCYSRRGVFDLDLPHELATQPPQFLREPAARISAADVNPAATRPLRDTYSSLRRARIQCSAAVTPSQGKLYMIKRVHLHIAAFPDSVRPSRSRICGPRGVRISSPPAKRFLRLAGHSSIHTQL
ncbi:hypothetical protein C2E23DRAFT_94196 [Lenzites betulinus]|nr:hypothetical protein C2E23DRAFT_94196 [Lenzites betulinus]